MRCSSPVRDVERRIKEKWHYVVDRMVRVHAKNRQTAAAAVWGAEAARLIIIGTREGERRDWGLCDRVQRSDDKGNGKTELIALHRSFSAQQKVMESLFLRLSCTIAHLCTTGWYGDPFPSFSSSSRGEEVVRRRRRKREAVCSCFFSPRCIFTRRLDYQEQQQAEKFHSFLHGWIAHWNGDWRGKRNTIE